MGDSSGRCASSVDAGPCIVWTYLLRLRFPSRGGAGGRADAGRESWDGSGCGVSRSLVRDEAYEIDIDDRHR